MQRVQRRWKTTFGSWVMDYGVRRLVRGLEAHGQPVTEKAVYHWISGRHAPRGGHALAIVRLSRGRLSLEDVLRQGQLATVGRAVPQLEQ